jgi:hypothetical protein
MRNTYVQITSGYHSHKNDKTTSLNVVLKNKRSSGRAARHTQGLLSRSLLQTLRCLHGSIYAVTRTKLCST